jgi:hypothetical protein
MPPVKTPVPPQAEPIYLACLGARGVGNKTFDSGARCFLARYPDPQAWARLPLERRLADTPGRRFRGGTTGLLAVAGGRCPG